MDSIWTETSDIPRFKHICGDAKTDVLIIGGGITGILCAYMLENAGVDYILTESEKICDGITKNTTAKITAQHGLIFDKLIHEFGKETAKKYLDANLDAVQKYRDLCGGIDCDFEEKDSLVYSIDDRKKLEDEINALNNIGFKATLTEKLPLPFSTVGAVIFGKQSQFNPLKFLSAISKNLKIYENTAVRELIGTTAVTDYGKIKAERIIVATHFPFLNKHGSYFLKMYQQRSYVTALENAADVNGMYVDEAKTGMSFRNYGNLLLVGGGGHRTGKKGGSFHELEEFKEKYYPNSNEKYRWATQDCMTLDGVPYIGPYSASRDKLYVATGYNKWGMTSSMAAAMILCDTVQGRCNEYAEAFSPSRTILRPQLALNGVESVVNLLTPSSKRCPHLGCALKWNPYEHSWDCPCHGSRFTKDGKLIDNPATGDLNKSTRRRMD